ncbi:MAG: YnbE family lipoprotein [Alphaproteobacteria bacterium]|jgi:hypothetical protein|nr:YnbE family lipoprotein [Rhodospirillaceae bacterium]MDG2481840.1 YnbE family lipoprotein [Alphaproteobacteria bacterium]MBT6205700.1 YnbE family lipoprotein [Rhodospirillaceae bacterium]MBT6509604.1 YnbE family lipoprotein [Rhodospirillaceae bacterium]MBT7614545.1 YnbE family lipoprotein [Rhodospirillaceae bacterium]
MVQHLPLTGFLPATLLLAVMLAACQPTVRIEAPKDPIVINLNVKIEQEVRIKIERDIEDLLEDDDAIF